jgi:hypothetical protein
VVLARRGERRRGGEAPTAVAAVRLDLQDQARGQEGHQESGFATHSRYSLQALGWLSVVLFRLVRRIPLLI